VSDTRAQAAFPQRFPIFPLPNVVLFPGTYLPLHVFEPRYRAMTEAALGGDEIIGMVLIRPGEDPMQARAPIFDVGCAGRIVESQRLPDGRFHLLLHGERRFRIAREDEARGGFRSVLAELLPDPSFAELAPDARRQLEATRVALEARMLELVALTVPDSRASLAERMRALDPVLLANAIAFGLDCPALEKQSLLEAPDVVAEVELLLRVLAFQIAAARLPEGPSSVN
jgi:Lon protease-like protein